MASVNFYIRGAKNPSNIYCRFSNSRSIDIFSKTNIFVNPKNWDKRHQKIRNVIEVKNRYDINRRLLELKIYLIDSFNLSFINGEVIDRDWLEAFISEFFNRPKGDIKGVGQDHAIYYLDFAKWWIEKKSSTWFVSSGSYMSKRVRMDYLGFLKLLQSFQGNSRLKLKSSGHDTLSNLIVWLKDKGYSEKTIRTYIHRFKFFCNRAKDEGFTIDHSYAKRVFIPKDEPILKPILDPKEIEAIYNLRLDDKALDSARDNLIIACWTGLRVSDFLDKLNISNFIDDYIEITTTKTRTPVVIPVHPMVKRILIKHKSKLPPRLRKYLFNDQVREVCKKANINQEMKGSLFQKDVGRKVTGIYKKYELVSSHIGRRSFVTNHYGKLPDTVLCSIGGWSTVGMMLKYLNKSNRDQAEILKAYWDKKYNYVA